MKLLLVLFATLPLACPAQTNQKLHVIRTVEEYNKSVLANPAKKLVEIQKIVPDIKLDIKYATRNNFAKQAVYDQARAFARMPVVKALAAVQSDLKSKGLGLKIFDGYRPYSVTVKFFELASDKNFVANPKDGSRHNRGCAIDLTLIDIKTGKEIAMPTPYDSFSPAAAVTYKDLDAKVIRNRDLLISTMHRFGFRVVANEWWHFDYTGWREYELLDIPFEKL